MKKKIELTEDQKKREIGYYWVKRVPDKKGRERKWEVGKWTGTHWNIPSCFRVIKNEALLKVIMPTRLLNPEEL